MVHPLRLESQRDRVHPVHVLVGPRFRPLVFQTVASKIGPIQRTRWPAVRSISPARVRLPKRDSKPRWSTYAITATYRFPSGTSLSSRMVSATAVAVAKAADI